MSTNNSKELEFVFATAKQYAAEMKRPQIATEHLLLSIYDDPSLPSYIELRDYNLDPHAMYDIALSMEEEDPSHIDKIFTKMQRKARKSHESNLTDIILLHAITTTPCNANNILRQMGVDVTTLGLSLENIIRKRHHRHTQQNLVSVTSQTATAQSLSTLERARPPRTTLNSAFNSTRELHAFFNLASEVEPFSPPSSAAEYVQGLASEPSRASNIIDPHYSSAYNRPGILARTPSQAKKLPPPPPQAPPTSSPVGSRPITPAPPFPTSTQASSTPPAATSTIQSLTGQPLIPDAFRSRSKYESRFDIHPSKITEPPKKQEIEEPIALKQPATEPEPTPAPSVPEEPPKTPEVPQEEQKKKKDKPSTKSSLSADRVFGGKTPKVSEEYLNAIMKELDADEAQFHELALKEETPRKEEEKSIHSNSYTSNATRASHAVHPENKRLAELYLIDKKQYPTIAELASSNLTYKAAMGEIDDVIDRDLEITKIIEILGMRRCNNPLLIGYPGVGKTAIVEGLAHRFVEFAKKGSPIGQRAIVEISVGSLISGTQVRGSFAQRFTALREELKAAKGDIIVFMDEFHMILGPGGGADGTDSATELKTALARGEFPCIGATTPMEAAKYLENDPALMRRFNIVPIDEPSLEATLKILEGLVPRYEAHHALTYDKDAIVAAATLSQRFIHERRFPDKVVTIIDRLGSRISTYGGKRVTADDVTRFIAEHADIPYERLSQSEYTRLLNMESILSKQLIGHHHVVKAVSDIIRRNHANFRQGRPVGSLLFLGPTGVGKTEFVRVLADFLFHDRQAICRFDMSEFSEPQSVARLIGAPPGYVGFDSGGQLTESVRRRPYQIILFDEFEKAHHEVWNLFLQLLDEGRLTDSKGRTVSFENCLIIMTSNLGASVFDESHRAAMTARIGFASANASNPEELRQKVLSIAKKEIPAELWNRIEEPLVFNPLTLKEVGEVADLLLNRYAQDLYKGRKITLSFGPGLKQFLLEHGGYDPQYGARPMQKTIRRHVEKIVAECVLSNDIKRGDDVMIDAIEIDGEKKITLTRVTK